MDRKDIGRLFNLMRKLYPNARRFSDDETMLAWHLVLEPFSYDEIKAAAVDYARANPHPPDPNELCGRYVVNEPVPEIPDSDDAVEQLRTRWYERVKQRRALGLPATITEAVEQGLSSAQWLAALDMAGVGL